MLNELTPGLDEKLYERALVIGAWAAGPEEIAEMYREQTPTP